MGAPTLQMRMDAAAKCDVVALRRCLTREALEAFPIDARSSMLVGYTALQCVCMCDHERKFNVADVEQCLQLLVEAGADLEARLPRGGTLLHAMAEISSRSTGPAAVHITSLLLRHGAAVNSTDNAPLHASLASANSTRNRTPLHKASLGGDPSMIALLLKAGAAVNAQDVHGKTPLDIALILGGRKIIPILLSAGGKLNEQLYRGGELNFSDSRESDTALAYLAKIDAAAGFKKYEQAHLARVTSIVVPTPLLPSEMVRHVVSFWLHAGYY